MASRNIANSSSCFVIWIRILTTNFRKRKSPKFRFRTQSERHRRFPCRTKSLDFYRNSHVHSFPFCIFVWTGRVSNMRISKSKSALICVCHVPRSRERRKRIEYNHVLRCLTSTVLYFPETTEYVGFYQEKKCLDSHRTD